MAPCHAASTSHPLTCGARRRTRTSLFAFVAQSPHPEVRAQHMERGSPLVFQRPDNTWRPWLESNQQPSVLETEAAPPPHGPTDSRPTTHLRCKQSAPALVLIAPGASARCRKTTRLRGWLERIETEGWNLSKTHEVATLPCLSLATGRIPSDAFDGSQPHKRGGRDGHVPHGNY